MASLRDISNVLIALILACLSTTILSAPAIEEVGEENALPQSSPANATSHSNLTANNNGLLTCYDKTDPLFFSHMTAKYDVVNCMRVVPRFSRKLAGTDREDINFWFTSSYKKPLGLRDPAPQMPVYHKEEGCSVAIVSTKLLDQFTREKKIPWREEWGGRRRWEIAPQVITESTSELTELDGLLSLIDCFQMSEQIVKAGHLLSKDRKLHMFMWPGEWTTFGEILQIQGGTEIADIVAS